MQGKDGEHEYTYCVPMYCEKDITINRYGRLIIKG